MNQLRAESIPEDVIAGASALVLTSYLVRCKPGEPMPEATMKAIEYAKKYNVPVVLTPRPSLSLPRIRSGGSNSSKTTFLSLR